MPEFAGESQVLLAGWILEFYRSVHAQLDFPNYCLLAMKGEYLYMKCQVRGTQIPEYEHEATQ